MRQAYANIEKVLAQYGATMENIVEEVLFVTDMDAAFAARVKCWQEVFSGTQCWRVPLCKSNVSVLRAYDRDQVYLRSVRPLGRNLEIEVFLTLSFFIRLFISNNNSTVVFAAASIADVMVPISYGT